MLISPFAHFDWTNLAVKFAKVNGERETGDAPDVNASDDLKHGPGRVLLGLSAPVRPL